MSITCFIIIISVPTIIAHLIRLRYFMNSLREYLKEVACEV